MQRDHHQDIPENIIVKDSLRKTSLSAYAQLVDNRTLRMNSKQFKSSRYVNRNLQKISIQAITLLNVNGRLLKISKQAFYSTMTQHSSNGVEDFRQDHKQQ